MKPSRGWIIVVAIVALLIGARAMMGNGMGRVYVKSTDVKIDVPADTKSGAAATTVTWTDWQQVPPRAYYEAEAKDSAQVDVSFSWTRTIGLWLAAFFTLAIFSFLYRDNPAYRLAEAVIIGVSAAYWMVLGFWETVVPKLLGALTPDMVRSWVLPSQIDQPMEQIAAMYFALVLGLLLLMRLAPKGGWISMWPLAFIIGVTAGLKIVSHIESDLIAQAVATFKPLIAVKTDAAGAVTAWPTVWASLANILLVVGVLCCLTYFFFSVEHKGLVGRGARVGIWYLMITFGAAFGFTVMGRVALLAARVEFLFDDWLWLIDPAQKRIVETLSMLGVW